MLTVTLKVGISASANVMRSAKLASDKLLLPRLWKFFGISLQNFGIYCTRVGPIGLPCISVYITQECMHVANPL